jgi:uncharacterized protein (TIGR02996 family)
MAARRDDWLLRADKKDVAELPKLLAEVMDTSLPGLEARLLALTTFPPNPAIGKVAATFFAKFPVRFREQLGTACAAVGVAWLHRERMPAAPKLKKQKAPNAQVNAWYALVPRALAAALEKRRPAEKETGRLAPLPVGPRDAFQAAWLERAASRAPETLPMLLERFAEGPATHVAERALSLLSFAPDPRIGDAASAFLARPSVRVSAEVPLFTELALVLCVHGHRGHRKAVEAFTGALPSLRWLEAALPDGAPPVPAAAPARPRSAPSTEMGFLRFLADAPQDDARRALFTDWLLEQGLPRGEFMSLQRAGRPLTPRESKRVAALQKQHERTWLGSLSSGHRKGSVRYVDGVLREIELALSHAAQLPAEDEPRLATIQRLELEGGTDLPLGQVLASAQWRSLQSLTAPLWVLDEAPAALLGSLRELGLMEPRLGDERKPFDFLRGRAFPKLEAMRLVGQWWQDVAGFERLPQRQQIQRLEVETTTPVPWFRLAASLEHLEVLPGTSRHSDDGLRGFRFHFARGQALRISAPLEPHAHSVERNLLEPLRQVSPRARRGATLELPTPLAREHQQAFESLVTH